MREPIVGDFKIKITHPDGSPMIGALVSCDYYGFWHDEYTDDDGWVTYPLPNAPMLGKEGVRGVYVFGTQVSEPIVPKDGDEIVLVTGPFVPES